MCDLFRCKDVEPEAGRVVRTRGAYVLPPSAVQSPQRNWGYPWQLPGRPEPVFVIRWYRRELLPSQKKLELSCRLRLRLKPGLHGLEKRGYLLGHFQRHLHHGRDFSHASACYRQPALSSGMLRISSTPGPAPFPW